MVLGKTLRRFTAIIAASVAVGAGIVVGVAAPATAANAVDFDPGYIISDANFYNANAMNEGQIEAFMRGMLPSCAQANGASCLPNYSESTVTRAATTRCATYEGGASEPASRIINKVAKACGINPQVILATLQKENGLVTKQSPTAGAYRTAMGYACPDTAACDAAYFGFFNQVYSAASQFIRYGVNPSSWRYRPGAVSVQFHPNAACGSTVVNIQNKATAALYNYTPYQPNAAALRNLGGTGDGCSSYGNRNFWVYFSDWFGSPTGKINPFGAVDYVHGGPGYLSVGGWAIDPDSAASLDVHVYVDGVGTALQANQQRPDVGAVYPASGAAHGFSAIVPVAAGVHSVCIYAINVGPGASPPLDCRTVSTPTGAPIGFVDAISSVPGQLTIGGWSIDPDTDRANQVHVYVDSVGISVNADQQRADIGAGYPVYGAYHGFTATVPASPGAHQVCAYGINIAGPQGHTPMGCYRVVVPAVAGTIPELGRSPIGYIDTLSSAPDTLTVTGWALDPDTAASTDVHVYVDGVGVASRADQNRDDIAAAYPGYGAAHGFAVTVPASPGSRQVCVYAINTAAGDNPNLGCRQISVAGAAISERGRIPIGVVDSLTTAPGSISLWGWALDPDSTVATFVHVYVDGVSNHVPADQVRPDIASAFPGYGPNHGFAVTLPAAAGPHDVCTYAINTAAGANPLLSCSRVVVG
jgi:hypothetical protein